MTSSLAHFTPTIPSKDPAAQAPVETPAVEAVVPESVVEVVEESKDGPETQPGL